MPTDSPAADQGVDRLADRAGARPHEHDDPLRVRGAAVVDEAVAPARPLGEARPSRPARSPGTASWKGLAASRAWKNTSGFCAVPRTTGRSGGHATGAEAMTSSSRISARMSSSVEQRDLVDLVARAEAVEEVQERDPDAQGRRVGDEGEVMRLLHRAGGTASPSRSVRACMTSLWSPKIDSACVATVRAATWMTVGVSSPAILNMLGTISSRPCDAVKVVAERTFLERAVQRAGGTGLGLHFHDLAGRSPTGSAGRQPPSRRSAPPIGDAGVIG